MHGYQISTEPAASLLPSSEILDFLSKCAVGVKSSSKCIGNAYLALSITGRRLEEYGRQGVIHCNILEKISVEERLQPSAYAGFV